MPPSISNSAPLFCPLPNPMHPGSSSLVAYHLFPGKRCCRGPHRDAAPAGLRPRAAEDQSSTAHPPPLAETGATRIHHFGGARVSRPTGIAKMNAPNAPVALLNNCGSTWLNMAQHGLTWLNMAQHGSTWLNMVQHGSTWLNMAQHGSTPSTQHAPSPCGNFSG